MARALVRLAVVLCLATAAVSLAALSGEYPGWSRAGVRVATRELLPLVLVPWLHLAALAATAPGAPGAAGALGRGRTGWLAAALLADVALFARAVPHARAGAPPVALAVPVIAALLALGTLGLAWGGAPWRRAGGGR